MERYVAFLRGVNLGTRPRGPAGDRGPTTRTMGTVEQIATKYG
ncbi:MAG TPA: hypothetical protein VFY75_01995 [Solirubrobacterales bacterium]|nr:hypothetical protein [Solirubrobacterales bacterium]